MSTRDTSRRRLGLESLEDRTALTAGLNAVVQLGEIAPSMQVQYQTPSLAAVASDPRFAEQWALKNTGQQGGKVGADIGATRAWDVTKGSTKITVSVMDTGVDYTHADLYANIWLNQGEIPSAIRSRLTDIDGDGKITFRDLNDSRNKGTGKITDLNKNGYIDGGDVLKPVAQGGWADGVSNDGDSYKDDLVGWDFADNDNNPMDSHGHGTHIAGTIGAMGNNNVGVSGINWVSQIMAIRFVDGAGGGSISAFIAGLNYAVAKGAKISNNSWTGSSAGESFHQAIDNARAKGHIVVAAAGNAGQNNDVIPVYPANFTQNNVVTVAATDRYDKLASYSNYGARSVDIAAPGGDILSTKLGGGYYFNSGTSMATPHVAGALALVWAKNPSWSYTQVISQVLNTADRLTSLAGKVASGRLNVGAAVGAVTVSSSAPRVINAVNLGNSTTSIETVRVTFDRAMSATSFTAGDVTVTGPDGKAILVTKVAAVVGYSNKVFDVTFARQTRGGNYTVKVGPDVKDLAGIQMTVFTRTFTLTTPVTTTAPRIVNSVNLGNSTTSMETIRVTFDRVMNPSSFTPGDVGLTGPDGKAIVVTKVTAVVGYSNKVFDVTFARQTRGGNYTVKVGPDVKDLAGKQMTVFTRTFTLTTPVTTTAPRIVNAVNPTNSTTSLGTIRVSFDRVMSASSFGTGDVVLTGPDGKPITITKVAPAAGYGDKVFDLTFATQTRGGNYTVKVGPDVKDTAGRQMAVFTKTFTLTTPTTQPATGARIVNAVNPANSTTSLGTIRVTFDRVMSASSFGTGDVILTGPDGKAIAITKVAAVAGYGDRVFDITFATQARGGNYAVKVGPDVKDTAGRQMAVFTKTFTLTSAVTQTPTVTSKTYTSSTKVTVPPRGRGVSMITVDDNVTIADVNVELNITHPRTSDLYIHLQAPDGTNIVLVNRKGGSSANFVHTKLDDSATTPVGFSRGPFTGTYSPDVPLSTLNGKLAKGAWKLWVVDRAGVNRGTIEGWSLTIRRK